MMPDGKVDLLKIDIEGSEKELLGTNLRWLDRVGAIIAELHFGLDGNNELIGILASHGFAYYPPQNRDPGAKHLSDFFLRHDWVFS